MENPVAALTFWQIMENVPYGSIDTIEKSIHCTQVLFYGIHAYMYIVSTLSELKD